MDDLTALRELRGDAPAAEAGQLARGRWKLMAAAVAEEESGPARARQNRLPRGRLLRGRLRSTVFAAVTAAAVTGGVLVALPGSSGGPDGAAEPQTVATVLAAAAVTAEQSPLPRPTADQWVFHDEVACDAGCGINPQWVKGDGSLWVTPEKRPVPGKKPVLEQRPTPRNAAVDDIRFEPIKTYDAFAQLPTDPKALLKKVSTDPRFILVHPMPDQPRPPVLPTASPSPVKIKVRDPKTGKLVTRTVWSRWPVPPARVPAKPIRLTPEMQYQNILALMQQAPVIPPKVNAALFKALALIPGTELVKTPMKDAFGRPSITISATRDSTGWLLDRNNPGKFKKVVTHFTTYLFLDPRTYAFRGYRTLIDDGHGIVPEERTRKATAVVDKPGTVEGGADWVGYKLPKWDGIPAPRQER
ncbi:hypothetical protein KQY30_03445 [Streptomyces sp. GMY02]|uniref:hypothetical protein n=1 Tax=Streptomyces sp. GMY02 TaxID=1333528 RepID=UPI001C2BC591|nr:hypothetical protein [Streptomyces sp. GMY02]QXE33483.1 hypothetical protein KQY30_03445 [Streptomyces sp. GMY02]